MPADFVLHNFFGKLCSFTYTQNPSFMEKSDVTNRVKNVVGDVLKIDPSEIGSDANFIFDLGANSMQSILLVGAFEEEFNIEMDEDKALEIQNIADAVGFINEYL